ncbi:MAG: hypothetical protein IJ693_02380 [Bacteroidaceae bacterium]|nr:hypothetical protein [Bacteroidaceae bacterium]
MKTYILRPVIFAIGGLTFYIYNGVTWNTWIEYLPHIIGYMVILAVLGWALYKKEQLRKS